MRDAWNKSADFAMANDVLTEGSLFLLGSNCPEHQAKGISLHLQGDLRQLEATEGAKESFIQVTKRKIAAIHGANPEDIVIVNLAEGSVGVTYCLPPNSSPLTDLERQYQAQFGASYLGHQIHPAFVQLQINPDTFAPQWNRDFRISGNCPSGENRAGQPYFPPAGWRRFGMKVAGKFAGGDGWLGMSSGPGEWCVAYHGTKQSYVQPISQSPLRAGWLNAYGYGIYCSPNPAVAEGYTDCLPVQTRNGTVNCKYMFMCRVNVQAIHRCTTIPCPLANDPAYTLHMTTSPNIWFVNAQNQGYQNIRPYGILVKDN
jgi:hypothetical protein